MRTGTRRRRVKGFTSGLQGTALVMFLSFAVFGVVQAAAPAPAVKPVTPQQLKAEVAKRRGKVVLVNVWATWCPPCVAAYPGIVKLSRKYKSQGLEVLSISADDPKNLKKQVVPFLAKQKPNFALFIKAPGDDEAFIKAMDPKWYGDLPADFLFGPDGKPLASMTGETNLAKLEGMVKQQLAQVPTKKNQRVTRRAEVPR